eukprot:Hpha_TRINITY_DN15107_c0_g2::TRINITY_DN15107_c0_g2_i1::g.128224::m.128224/K21278/DUSP1; dual specificity protein phosphatase 1
MATKTKTKKKPLPPPVPALAIEIQNHPPVFRVTEEDKKAMENQANAGVKFETQIMSQIRPWLFLGSIADALDRDRLTANGVTHILNAAKECDSGSPDAHADYGGLVYKKLNLVDHSDEPIVGVFEEAFEFIEGAKRGGGKVLVHCHRGISRSATLVIAYVMKTEELSLEAAFESVRAKRSIVNPNLGFVLTLQGYQNQLYPEHLVSHGAHESIATLYAGHDCPTNANY